MGGGVGVVVVVRCWPQTGGELQGTEGEITMVGIANQCFFYYYCAEIYSVFALLLRHTTTWR